MESGKKRSTGRISLLSPACITHPALPERRERDSISKVRRSLSTRRDAGKCSAHTRLMVRSCACRRQSWPAWTRNTIYSLHRSKPATIHSQVCKHVWLLCHDFRIPDGRYNRVVDHFPSRLSQNAAVEVSGFTRSYVSDQSNEVILCACILSCCAHCSTKTKKMGGGEGKSTRRIERRNVRGTKQNENGRVKKKL